MQVIEPVIDRIVHIFQAASPYLLLGLLLAGVIGRVFRREWVVRTLGSDSVWSVVKAAVLGAPLPLCSCGVIPTTIGLRRAGAGRGACMSFLISTPETGADSIIITHALINPIMTVTRPLVAVVSAVVGGTAALFLNRQASAKQGPANPDASGARGSACCGPQPPATLSGCCGSEAGRAEASCHMPGAEAAGECNSPVRGAKPGCCPPAAAAAGSVPKVEAPTPLVARFARTGWGVMQYGFGTILGDIARWVLLGFVLAGAAAAYIPDDFFAERVSSPWAQMGLMAALSLPLYLCSTSTTPVAAALMLKGLHPGAALVMLTLGPATNVTTMVVIAKEFGLRFLAVYQGTILLVGFAAGAALDALRPYWPQMTDAALGAACCHPVSAFSNLCALTLSFLLMYHLFGGLRRKRGRVA